jgi:hypothetical protein
MRTKAELTLSFIFPLLHLISPRSLSPSSSYTLSLLASLCTTLQSSPIPPLRQLGPPGQALLGRAQEAFGRQDLEFCSFSSAILSSFFHLLVSRVGVVEPVRVGARSSSSRRGARVSLVLLASKQHVPHPLANVTDSSNATTRLFAHESRPDSQLGEEGVQVETGVPALLREPGGQSEELCCSCRPSYLLQPTLTLCMIRRYARHARRYARDARGHARSFQG